MLVRIHNDVTLELTTGHWSGHAWMNCWCLAEGPPTVGPTGNMYFRHTGHTSHRDLKKDAFPPLLLSQSVMSHILLSHIL